MRRRISSFRALKDESMSQDRGTPRFYCLGRVEVDGQGSRASDLDLFVSQVD